jgi:hypothetical protein
MNLANKIPSVLVSCVCPEPRPVFCTYISDEFMPTLTEVRREQRLRSALGLLRDIRKELTA